MKTERQIFEAVIDRLRGDEYVNGTQYGVDLIDKITEEFFKELSQQAKGSKS